MSWRLSSGGSPWNFSNLARSLERERALVSERVVRREPQKDKEKRVVVVVEVEFEEQQKWLLGYVEAIFELVF